MGERAVLCVVSFACGVAVAAAWSAVAALAARGRLYQGAGGACGIAPGALRELAARCAPAVRTEALLGAVESGQHALVAALTNPLCDPNQRTTGGELPLVAAAAVDTDMVNVLLRARADPDGSDARRVTALCVLASRGDLAGITALVEAGATVDSIADSMCSPLVWAIAAGQVDAVRLLLSRGADPTKTDAAAAATRLGLTEIAALLEGHESEGGDAA